MREGHAGMLVLLGVSLCHVYLADIELIGDSVWQPEYLGASQQR